MYTASEVIGAGRALTLWLALCPLSACGTEDEQAESNSPQGLAALFDTELEPDGIAAVQQAFMQLSAEDLETFNEAREREQISRVTGGTDGSAQADAVEQLRTATKLRKEINRLSLERYGKPYNQLEGEQLDALLLQLDHQPGERTHEKASCDAGNYPLTATAGSGGSGVRYSTYYYNRINGQSDCDLVFAYRGTFSRMRAMTPADALLLNQLGGRTAMRQTGYTDIVLGTNKVWLLYGHPQFVTLRMY